LHTGLPSLAFWTNSSRNRGQHNTLPRIDNYIRNEYTGNHYDHYGDPNPRTKYGQVSMPSHLIRGVLYQ